MNSFIRKLIQNEFVSIVCLFVSMVIAVVVSMVVIINYKTCAQIHTHSVYMFANNATKKQLFEEFSSVSRKRAINSEPGSDSD